MQASGLILKLDEEDKRLERSKQVYNFALALADVEELVFPKDKDYTWNSKYKQELTELLDKPEVARAVEILQDLFKDRLDAREIELDEFWI